MDYQRPPLKSKSAILIDYFKNSIYLKLNRDLSENVGHTQRVIGLFKRKPHCLAAGLTKYEAIEDSVNFDLQHKAVKLLVHVSTAFPHLSPAFPAPRTHYLCAAAVVAFPRQCNCQYT